MRWIGLLPSLLVVLIAILSSFRIVRFGHRMVLFRFGRRAGIRRPGIRWIIPLVDRPVDMDLEKEIPGWGKMAEKRLEARIIELVENRNGKGVPGSTPLP